VPWIFTCQKPKKLRAEHQTGLGHNYSLMSHARVSFRVRAGEKKKLQTKPGKRRGVREKEWVKDLKQPSFRNRGAHCKSSGLEGKNSRKKRTAGHAY